ncbi:MAG: pirin family protein [Betaproteobacteria bacterium]|nr:pirin family protein [Betaproteobacteria bacterium]MSQ88237.1 pirin family protein [Betaproteobacteria bacterium]
MASRKIQQIIDALPASDGAGVKLMRSLGSAQHLRVDPFLMLDAFSSDNPDDYLAGFPSHPHRGFETVTYLLEGHMLHEDHLGNRGDLKSGAVQWMTAGRGIIHSEMPQQENGRMRGFQLWINLPAKEKMKPAGYRDIQPAEIPEVALPGGGRVKVIAGVLELDGKETAGPVQGSSTQPLYLDVELPPNGEFVQKIKIENSAYLYPFEGSAAIDARVLRTHQGGVLGPGDSIEVRAGTDGVRFLLLAGRPLLEPIVQHGPFVMNTRAEIEQAIRDYQNGELTKTAA